MIFTVGHPNGAVQEASTSCDTEIIPVQGEKIKNLILENPYYVESIIPGGTYAGNPKDIKTFGVKATVVALDNLGDETVYQIVKSVFDNFDSFKALHPVFSSLNMKKMVKEGNTIPLHKGAIKYFKENNLLTENN
jgi:TRAP transporter TAXI family solute receptor